MWRFLHLFSSVFIIIVQTIIHRLFNNPKVRSWSLWMELDVSIIMESVKVLDVQNFSWKEIRFLQDLSSKRLKRGEAKVEKVCCNGILGELITSRAIDQPTRTVFYLHGGGFCVGSPTSYRKPIAHLSKRTRSRFLLLDYALAPERQYPFALEQAFEAYKWLVEQHRGNTSEIVLAGDSAGGGLCVSLLTLLRDRNFPLPSCGVLMSPWTNLSETSCLRNKEMWTCEEIPFNPNNLGVRFSKAYIGGNDTRDPLISPYFADLKNLPPILLTAGGGEGLLTDINHFHHKCLKDDVDVTYDVVPNMPHVYQILHQELDPQVEASIDRVKDFIDIWTQPRSDSISHASNSS